MADFNRYISPFSWRYASDEMRQIWSESHKRRLWRNLWVSLAQAQAELGLVRPEQVADLRTHANDIDIPRALEIEAEIHHDLMAEVRVFAEQCPTGRGIIHLGATSMDIEDNADALRLREALDVILEKLEPCCACWPKRWTHPRKRRSSPLPISSPRNPLPSATAWPSTPRIC